MVRPGRIPAALNSPQQQLPQWDESPIDRLSAQVKALGDTLSDHFSSQENMPTSPPPTRDAFYILLPLLIILSTFLFLILLFLVCIIILRRRRGIMLRDNDGPVDMSREDLVEGEGGFEGVESRWLESVSEGVRRAYHRAKGKHPYGHTACNPISKTDMRIISLCIAFCNRISTTVSTKLLTH